jgi:hypothetical protein
VQQSSRRYKLILAALVLMSAVLGLLRFNTFQVGTWVDDAHYVVLAESLAQGQGYHLINYPDAPVGRAFPPGWPLLLAPVVAAFPGNYAILKLLSFVFWLGSIPLMYRFFASRLEKPYAEILVAFVVLNPNLVALSGMAMSEPAYLFFSFLALNLFDCWDAGSGRAKPYLLVAIVLLALYAQLIRTLGLSLLIALSFYLLLSRRFRDFAIVAGTTMLGLMPQFWLNSQSGGSLVTSANQTQYFGCVRPEVECTIFVKAGYMWTNLESYANPMISNAVLPFFGGPGSSILGRLGLGLLPSLINALLLLTILFGVALSLRRVFVHDLWVVIYFLALLPFVDVNQGGAQPRYLIPLIPFLYFYVLRTLSYLLSQINAQKHKWAAVALPTLVVLVCSLLIGRNLQDWRNPVRNRITDISVGTTWVSENTPHDAIVMVRDPVPDYLYARRKTVAYPSNESDIEVSVRKNRVGYIIVSPRLQTPRTSQLDGFTESTFLPYLVSNSDRFVAVYRDSTQNVTVYQVRSTE